jgi:hypothetical protein
MFSFEGIHPTTLQTEIYTRCLDNDYFIRGGGGGVVFSKIFRVERKQ